MVAEPCELPPSPFTAADSESTNAGAAPGGRGHDVQILHGRAHLAVPENLGEPHHVAPVLQVLRCKGMPEPCSPALSFSTLDVAATEGWPAPIAGWRQGPFWLDGPSSGVTYVLPSR
jgi:hypothetical protein